MLGQHVLPAPHRVGDPRAEDDPDAARKVQPRGLSASRFPTAIPPRQPPQPTRQPRTARSRIPANTPDEPGQAAGSGTVSGGSDRRLRPTVTVAGEVDFGGGAAAGPPDSVITWFLVSGTRPSTIEPVDKVEEVVVATLEQTPTNATHWSRTSMAPTGLSKSTIGRIWRRFELKPHCGTFKLSTDPLFVEKVVDVVGLYHNPPEAAVVLCVDEKSACRPWTAPSRCCR